MKNIFNFSNLTLLVALALSTIAAYYSIIGLTAIFAGAVMPVIVMGSILEVGKIVTTVWLRKYWKQATWVLKAYLVPAVVSLALLTSMGIFGFLSKAHMDQSVVSGDVQAKLSLYDEKIKTERQNIDAARKALQQMDSQLDQLLSRGTTEQNAERTVQIRRQQAKERAKLQGEIATAQAAIAKLNEERAPIAAENRKVEAEVGPIKYIAALIYGDNPDTNILERAVRWVIILIVAVFDPLAIALVLAANASREWDRKSETKPETNTLPQVEEPEKTETKEEPVLEEPKKNSILVEPVENKDTYDVNEKTHPYLYNSEGWRKNIPSYNEYLVEKPALQPVVEPVVTAVEEIPQEPVENITPVIEEPVVAGPVAVESIEIHPVPTEPITIEDQANDIAIVETGEVPNDIVISTIEPTVEAITVEEIPTEEVKIEEPQVQETVAEEPVIEDTVKADNQEVTIDFIDQPQVVHVPDDHDTLHEVADNRVLYEGKTVSTDALREMRPDLFNESHNISTKFGIRFPKIANKGDMFVRVDVLPNKLYKFDGRRWFEVNKDTVDSYLDDEYIQFVIAKLESGEYDIELLTEKEKDQIESYLQTKNNTTT